MTEVEMVAGLVNEIRPLLGGYPREVQGTVLADLLAIWLAGHHARDESQTLPMRAALLHMHVKSVIYGCGLFSSRPIEELRLPCQREATRSEPQARPIRGPQSARDAGICGVGSNDPPMRKPEIPRL